MQLNCNKLQSANSADSFTAFWISKQILMQTQRNLGGFLIKVSFDRGLLAENPSTLQSRFRFLFRILDGWQNWNQQFKTVSSLE